MKRLTLFLALLFPSLAFGQAGGILTGGITVLSSSGRPVAGATVTICNSSDTGVPCTQTVNIFQDPALTIPAANPGTTDANGNFIAFASPGVYRFTATGNGVSTTGQPFLVTVSTPSAGGGNVLLAGNNVMTGQNTFTNNNTFSGNNTLSGQNTIKAYSINNIVTVDGQKYTTLSAAAADTLCASSAGCTIDMRGNSSPSALALASFDPGSTPMTILLGPYTYTTSGITLRANLHIFGVAGGGATASSTGTYIKPTTTSVPIIKMPATASAGIADVQLSDFRISCAPGNTNQVGINITAPTSSGLWYSTFSNIQVDSCMGDGILLDGSAGAPGPAINQFLEFRTVTVIRPSGAPSSIHIRGVNGQFIFTNCEFDAVAQFGGTHDSLPNVIVEDSLVGGIVAPYSIAMYQTTIQGAGIAIKLRGSQSFECDNCHFEHDWGILNTAVGQQFGSLGTIISNGIGYTSGSNSGSGYLITMDSSSQVSFNNNSFYGTPDNFYLGTLTHLTSYGLYNASNGQPFPGGPSSLRIAEGMFGDGSGFKAANVSTGSVPAGTRVSVTVPWTTAFPDTGYVPLCFIADFNPASNAQGLVAERVNSQSASQIQVTVFNPTGSSDTGNLGCVAVHQ